METSREIRQEFWRVVAITDGLNDQGGSVLVRQALELAQIQLHTAYKWQVNEETGEH